MEKWQISENGKRYLQIVTVVFSVYFAMKYISPVISPFLVAFLAAGLINPIVTKLQKRIRLKKSVLAGIILLFFLLVGIFICWLLGAALFAGGRSLAGKLPDFQRELLIVLENSCDGIEERFGIDSLVIENFVTEQVEVLTENLEVNVFPAVMGKSVGAVKVIGSIFGFLAVALIAVLLIIKDYDKVMRRLIEEESFRGIVEICVKVVVYIKTFVKAQAVILCIISSICAVTLGLAGIRGGVVYGLITGVMDMLPFIGTGIMLMPLALILFLQQSYLRAVVCVVLYVVCALVREFLEPRLIGNKVGVWPVGILFAVFAGIKLFGIVGIIKGPLSLVIICEICKYLWKKEI